MGNVLLRFIVAEANTHAIKLSFGVSHVRATLVGLALATLVSTTLAQDRARKADVLRLDQFHPRSMLKVPQHHLSRAKIPAVDVHTHFDRRLRRTQQSLDDFVQIMDRFAAAGHGPFITRAVAVVIDRIAGLRRDVADRVATVAAGDPGAAARRRAGLAGHAAFLSLAPVGRIGVAIEPARLAATHRATTGHAR